MISSVTTQFFSAVTSAASRDATELCFMGKMVPSPTAMPQRLEEEAAAGRQRT